MARVSALILLSFFAYRAHAQIILGCLGGISMSANRSARTEPVFEALALKKLHTNISYGCSAIFQKYFYTFNFNDSFPHKGSVISVADKYSFVFILPEIDFGIGRRKYIHLNFCLGPGIIVANKKWTSKYSAIYYSTSGTILSKEITTTYTSDRPNGAKVRFGVGFSEFLPVKKRIEVIFSQKFNLLPDGYTYYNDRGAIRYLTANYLSFSIGIVHKYAKKPVEKV